MSNQATMTRRHFELIAKVLADSAERATEREQKVITAIAWEFSRALAETNQLFDADRFLAAAGIKKE